MVVSQHVASEIDGEVTPSGTAHVQVDRIVRGAYQRALDLMKANETVLHQLVARLLDAQVLKEGDLEEILGPKRGAGAVAGSSKQPQQTVPVPTPS